MIEPVSQGMLGLSERPLHDPMVTQNESSDEELVNPGGHQGGQVAVYDNVDTDMFMVRIIVM
jgi:hypothetical protein